jgi:DNA helicase HerA-like ATPase
MSNFQFRLGETDDGKPVMLDLPTLIETRLFDLASSGGGKSYALRVLIEKTAGHVQWIVIDPEGEFSSLREKFDFLLVGKDGEGSGAIWVFG